MSLSDLAALGSFIGALAVVASLIYLGLQVHQNSKHTRALIQQGRSDRAVTLLLAQAQTDLATAYLGVQARAEPSIEDVRSRQVMLQMSALLVGLEDSFNQHADGLVSHDQFQSERKRIVMVIRNSETHKRFFAGTRAMGNLSPGMQAFVNELLAEAETPVA
jgi:hypothetical protein